MNDRVARLMVRHHLALLWVQNHRFALFDIADFVARRLEVGLRDQRSVLQSGTDGRFIKEVREVRARHAGSGLSNDVQSLL